MRNTLPLFPLLLLSGLMAHAADTPPVPVYTMYYPPLHMGARQGKLPGIGDEMVMRAANLAGLPVVIHTVPWARAQLMAQQQANACVFPLTRLPAREAQYQWIGQVASGRLQLYGWPGAPRLPDLSAAAGYRLTVLAGSSAEWRLQQHKLTYTSTNLESDGLRLLQLGQSDFWAVHDIVARYEAQQARVKLQAVLSLGEANSWLACHRHFPAASKQALQQAFSRLQASGEATLIRQRYVSDTPAESSSER